MSHSTPGYPQQPSQPKKRRGCLWATLITLGALVLFGFVGCVALVATVGEEPGASDTNAAKEGGAEGGKKDAEKKEKAAAVGDTVEDGDFAFTVTDVESGVTSVGDEFLEQKPQGQFVIVSVTVKNIGSKAQLFDGSSQKLFDADGTEYANDTEAEIYLDNAESFLEEINPGNELKAQVVFDVPKDVQPASIALHGSMISGGVTVKLS